LLGCCPVEQHELYYGLEWNQKCGITACFLAQVYLLSVIIDDLYVSRVGGGVVEFEHYIGKM